MSSETSAVRWSLIAPTVITLRELQGLLIVHVTVAPVVAGRADDHDAGVPKGIHGLDQRVHRRGLVDRMAEREVDDADPVLRLVVQDPLQAGQHVGAEAAAGAVEDADGDEARLRGQARHAAVGRVAAVADEDAGHVRAVAVGVDAVFRGRLRVRTALQGRVPTKSTAAIIVWMSGCRTRPSRRLRS